MAAGISTCTSYATKTLLKEKENSKSFLSKGSPSLEIFFLTILSHVPGPH